MTICKYFKKGNCKFGARCAFEHPRGFAASGTESTFFGSTRETQVSSADQPNISDITVDSIRKDLTTEKPIWPFSSYCPVKHGFSSLIANQDLSFEEVRLAAYNATNTGSMASYEQQLSQRASAIDTVVQSVLGDLPKAVRESQNNNSSTPSNASNSNRQGSTFGSSPSIFDQRSAPKSVFGQAAATQSVFAQSTPAQSAFGQSSQSQSVFGQSSSPQSTFGQPSQAQSIFGQSSQPQSAFGQRPQPQSVFGQSSSQQSVFVPSSQPQSAFTSALAPQSAFGQSSQPQSAFGQSSQLQSAFGQSAFGQISNPPTAFGATSQPQSLFATAATASSSPFTQSISSKPGVFGGTGSPFGSSQSSSPFPIGAGNQADVSRTSAFGSAVSAFGGPSTLASASKAADVSDPFASHLSSPFGAATQKAPETSQSAQSPASAFGSTVTTNQSAFGQIPPSSGTAFLQANKPAGPTSQGTTSASVNSSSLSFGQQNLGLATSALPTDTKGDTDNQAQLPEDLVECFRAETFTIGKIPEVPPPSSLIRL